jgi:hypothetical protein
MPQSDWMTLHDDQAGEGHKLAFPTMSSCAAIVARLPNTLVGIHKTMQWTNAAVRVFNHANALIGGANVISLHILSWRLDDQNAHDITQIRGALNCNNVPTYAFNYSNIGTKSFQAPRSDGELATDLCTFAEFHAFLSPDFYVKRTTKVVCQRDANAYRQFLGNNGGYSVARVMGFTETIDASNRHPIRWMDFTRV